MLDAVRDYVPALNGVIPASDRGFLLWCRIGRAKVVSDGRELVIREGDAAWVPDGYAAAVTSAPGTVMVPIVSHERTRKRAPLHPHTVPVPSAWQPALLSAYARSLGFLLSDDAEDVLLSLMPPREKPQYELPLSSPALYHVAEKARAQPASSKTVAEYATDAGMTVRTFERRFHAETGMSFRQWRRHVRVEAGLRALGSGETVGEAARSAGFASSSTFCRAVREVTGRSPRALRRSSPSSSFSLDTWKPGEPPALHSAWSGVRETPFDVALWAARGGGGVAMGGVTHQLLEGELVFLPAGHPHEVVVDADAVLLPIASRRQAGNAGAELRIVPAQHRLRAVLLHSSVVSYTPLVSPGFDPAELFSALLAASQPVVGGGQVFSVPSRAARLTHGARLLREGRSVAQVAAEVGYAHASGFRRAFRGHFGVVPSEFAKSAQRTGASATLRWMRRS